jgi:hypothetical protein
MLLEVFIVELLRWTWSFPPDQDFTLDFRQVPRRRGMGCGCGSRAAWAESRCGLLPP